MMTLPKYRSRYLPAMTQGQIAAIADKESVPVIIPTGAIEQHGPHLPVGVDSILGQAYLGAALPLVPDDVPVLVAPPITIGKSDEHRGFPGTLFVSTKTLGRLLTSIASQLHGWGFRTIAILNTHGGNISVLRYTMRQIQVELGMRTVFLTSKYKPALSLQEETFGFHANEWETSIMLEVTEGMVDLSQAGCEYPARLGETGILRPEGAPATYTWVTGDLSKTGIVGDAAAATAEKGKEWFQNYTQSLAEEITKLSAWAKDQAGK